MRYKKIYFNILLSCVLFECLYSRTAIAYKSSGRITLGGVGITERFNSDDYGSTNNDYLFGSARFFYKITDFSENRTEFVTDIRDKHDFFGKLNREQLTLEGRNDFQVRQLSVRWPKQSQQLSGQVGRFHLSEAGAVFVDGGSLEYSHSVERKSGFFAGLNPKSVEKSYLQLDVDALQAGFFSTYQSKDDGWDKNLYYSHGIVSQKYKSQDERTFFFHNLIYQWEDDSRWLSFLNYDFIPSSKVQTANLIYQQDWSPKYSTELSFLTIDVVEYRRKQGVLEKLSPSPYSETRGQVQRKNESKSEIGLEISSGLRQIDNLTRTELILGYSHPEFFTKNFDLRFKCGTRKNFTSQDLFSRVGFGYFSRAWESSLDLQYEVNSNNDLTTTHPMTIELAATNYFSKDLFLTGSLQRASDENVTVMSTFLKVGYRFGNQEIPPVRDGAAPRGPL